MAWLLILIPSSVPSLSLFSPSPHPTDVPAAASRLHYQQWEAPPHGRVLPRQCAFQRAADLHLVSDTSGTPAMARGQRGLAWAPGATGTCAGSGRSRARGEFSPPLVWSGSGCALAARGAISGSTALCSNERSATECG